MEIDEQLKSVTTNEDEREMMFLMDKLPHFFSTNNDHHQHHLTHEFLTPNNDANDRNNIFAHSPPEFPTTIHSSSSPTISFNTNNNNQWSDYDIMASNNHYTNIDDQYASLMNSTHFDMNSMTTHKRNSSIAAMREMIFRIAVMQPVHIDPESVKPPKRRNVKISKDPQSVAARHRRERISERIRILQRLVPGGTKMDTASMLDEAIHYVKFLKTQVQSLERAQATSSSASTSCCGIGFPVAMPTGSSSYFHHQSPTSSSHNVQHY